MTREKKTLNDWESTENSRVTANWGSLLVRTHLKGFGKPEKEAPSRTLQPVYVIVAIAGLVFVLALLLRAAG